MEQLYDVIIIGSGPAGLSAAIYAGRAKLKTLVIEQGTSGGQISSTAEIENYPGCEAVESGMSLVSRMELQAKKFGAEFVNDQVISVDLKSDTKGVFTFGADYFAKTVIIATGANPAKIGCKGEERLVGRGISYCATCDGAFFKNKVTCVVGGGDVALEDAIFLARGCQKVYIIHRRDEFRGAKVLQDELMNTENIEILYDSEITEIKGEDSVSTVTVKNKKSGETSELSVNGVFIAVGKNQNGGMIPADIKTNEKGYILAGEDCVTNIPGVFAAGDIRDKKLRQVVTAVADGANAVYSVQDYLISNK